jgi:hypothetical protein
MTGRITYDYEPVVTAMNEAPKAPPAQYRGYTIERIAPHYLYRIKPPEGYSPPRMLAGLFTQIERLKTEVDSFFISNPRDTAETSWEENVPTKRKRGRPPKRKIKASVHVGVANLEVQP